MRYRPVSCSSDWTLRGHSNRFSHVDYALHAALQAHADLDFIVISYDVACQYNKHVWERFSTQWPELEVLKDKVSFLVPKMHLMAHKGNCQYTQSFNFTKHVGRTDGEQTERNWSIGNANAGSTREMNAGHRHDTLNDHNNSFNFGKVRTIGELN